VTGTHIGTANPLFRRLATAAAFAGLFSYAVILAITPACINEIGRFYRVSPARLGALFFALMAGFLVAVLAGGWYSDRRGKMPVILAGCVCMAAGAFIFGTATVFALSVVATLLMGVGGGLTEGTATALVSDLHGGSRRTAMLNWSQVAFAVGAVASPLAVSQLLAAGMNWRSGYFAAAAVCALSAGAAVVALARGDTPRVAHVDRAGWRELLRDQWVLIPCIGMMLYVGAEIGQESWLAAYFERGLNSSAPLAAASVSLFWAGMGVGRAVAARVSRRVSDTTLIRCALGLAAVCQAALLLLRGPMWGIAATFAVGFCMAPTWPTILSIAGAARPRQSGTVFGIVVASGALGAAIFPPIIGALADLTGMRPALWLCFVLLVVNLGVFLRIRSRVTVPG